MNGTINEINIIDIEASGLHINSYPIEIAVLIQGNIHSWLITPETEWTYWNSTAESLHGISRQTLMADGLSAIQVAEELNELMETSSGVLYSDAVQWDADWLKTLYDTTESVQQFNLLPIEALLSAEEKANFNLNLKDIIRSGQYRQHRAEEDVKIIYECYKRTRFFA